MTVLGSPDARRHRELVEMLDEYAVEGLDTTSGSGLWNLPESRRHLRDEADVRSFVRLLAHLADPEAGFLDETVASHYFWLEDDEGRLVGFLAFRHELSAWLLELGGHIGYSVRPSRRREGHASRALALALGHAPSLGIDRVLVTCDLDNLASAAVIEACGGVQEDERGGKRRFWIDVD